jgi:hypothetical protein
LLPDAAGQKSKAEDGGAGARQLARQLDRTSRWAFPLAFLLVNLFLGVIFLGARAAPVALS